MADYKVKASLDSRNYRGNVTKMRTKTKELSKGIKGVGDIIKGTFIGGLMVKAATKFVSGIGRMVRAAVNMGSTLTDLEFQTGLSVTQLQLLENAANRAGTDLNTVTTAVLRMKRAQGDALGGGTEYLKSFEALGITIEDLEKSGPSELLELISKRFVDGGRSAEGLNSIMEIMGRSGARLQEVFLQVASGVDNLSRGFAMMSDEGAHANDMFADLIAEAGTGILRKVGETAGMIVNELAYMVSGIDAAQERVDDARSVRWRMKDAQRAKAVRARIAREEKEKNAELKRLDEVSRASFKSGQEEFQAIDKRLTEEKAARTKAAQQAVADEDFVGKQHAKFAKEREENEKRFQKIKENAQEIADVRRNEGRTIETGMIRRMGGMAGAVISPELQEQIRQTRIMKDQLIIQREIRDKEAGLA